MRKKPPKKLGKGTLIRGADGALYFVPDGGTWAFRLPAKETVDARALLDELDFIAKKDELPAFQGSGLVRRSAGDEVAMSSIGSRSWHGGGELQSR